MQSISPLGRVAREWWRTVLRDVVEVARFSDSSVLINRDYRALVMETAGA